MNVTPRRRARSDATRWRLECGICSHAFDVELDYARRMSSRCPSCGTENVWNEPDAPSAAPDPPTVPPAVVPPASV